MVFPEKFYPVPFAECRRSAPQIYRNIEHAAGPTMNELHLTMRGSLEMHAPNAAFFPCQGAIDLTDSTPIEQIGQIALAKKRSRKPRLSVCAFRSATKASSSGTG